MIDPAVDAPCMTRESAFVSEKKDRRARTGNTYFKMGNYKAAETMYRQAIEKNTDHAAALKNLAVTLYHQDRLTESAACYERPLKEEGENYGSSGKFLSDDRSPRRGPTRTRILDRITN